MSKNMIVKVQVPLSTNERIPFALIYNRERTLTQHWPITPDLMDAMDGQPKKYFKARFKDGTLTLDQEVEEQPW